MKIVGYSDRLSAAPGETVRFMVSCEEVDYQAQLVRLIHGDPSPSGPGFKEEEIPSAIDGRYLGRTQAIRTGSYARIEHHPSLDLDGSFTVGAWMLPTTPRSGA